MRPFIVDKELTDRLKELSEYAERNPYTLDDLFDIKNRDMKAPGDQPEFTVETVFGFKIVYTIELQPRGRIKHLTVSVEREGKLPNPHVVQEIMKLIGFTKEMQDCIIQREYAGIGKEAIGILEIPG